MALVASPHSRAPMLRWAQSADEENKVQQIIQTFQGLFHIQVPIEGAHYPAN